MADEQNGQKAEDEKEPKTRTRSTASSKSEQTNEETSAAEKRKAEAEERAKAKAEKDAEAKSKREAEKKERDEKREAERKEREEKRAAEKEQKEKEREEAKAAKEREKAEERQRQIDDGEIIFANFQNELVSAEDATGDFDGLTFSKTEPKKEQVAGRARDVILDLIEGATEVPMSGKELADKYGGGTVQWVSFFGMLRVLGHVQPYRFKGDGQSGLAYLWVGPTDDEFISNIEGEAQETIEEAGEEAEPVAA